MSALFRTARCVKILGKGVVKVVHRCDDAKENQKLGMYDFIFVIKNIARPYECLNSMLGNPDAYFLFGLTSQRWLVWRVEHRVQRSGGQARQGEAQHSHGKGRTIANSSLSAKLSRESIPCHAITITRAG